MRGRGTSVLPLLLLAVMAAAMAAAAPADRARMPDLLDPGGTFSTLQPGAPVPVPWQEVDLQRGATAWNIVTDPDMRIGLLTDADDTGVRLPHGGTRLLTAENIFVNVGTRTHTPSIAGLAGTGFLDSTSIMELGETPEHLVIIGWGVHRTGLRTDVPALRGRRHHPRHRAPPGAERGRGHRRRPPVDPVGRRDHLPPGHLRDLRGAGRQRGGGALERRRGRRRVRPGIPSDAGRRTCPATDTLNPRAARLALTDRGFIQNLLGSGGASRAERMVPYTLFTDPQLGRVGVTETEARKRGIDIRVSRLPMSRVARAIEMDETRGLMKAVVDAATDRILGVAVLGVEGGEIMSVLQVAMMGDLPFTGIRNGVFARPTLADSLNNLFMAMGNA